MTYPIPMADPVEAHVSFSKNSASVTMFIVGAVVTACVTVITVLVAAIVRPENTAVIATIIGVTTPVTMGLMAAGLQGIHRGVNGRLSQLLKVRAEQEQNRGRVQVLQQLYWQLTTMKPGTPEHDALAQQVRTETMKYFGVIERRDSTPRQASELPPPTVGP